MKIQTIHDLLKVLDFESLEKLQEYLTHEIYPVIITYDEQKVTLTTDADRVPFNKVLRFPFTEDDYDDAIVGLQCVTDYAMHEGYWHTHQDMYEHLALLYAEKHGVYEYKVNHNYMEYWSLYEEGFYFIRIDLDTDNREEVCHLPWNNQDDIPVPRFLISPEGHTMYNCFEG